MPRGAVLGVLATATFAAVVTIHNDVPRVDQLGHIVNAHDGSVVHFPGTPGYFMYGTVYENCTQVGTQCQAPCGYSPNTFALYTSPDLVSWHLESTDILPEMAKDNAVIDYWMPYVARNAATSQYVMQYWSGRCGFAKPCADIAVADSPFGPFTMVPPLALTATPSSQMGFFVDDDGRAYVRYNTGAPQHHVVQALTADWMATTTEYAIVFWKEAFAWLEGGGVFRRGDLVFYMTGTDCCFCEWGGGSQFWSARSPLGPWHPGIAPPLPTARCDLSGNWTSVGRPPDEALTLTQAPGSDNFTFVDARGSAHGWIDQSAGYVTFPPSAGDGRGVVTSADGARAGCDRIRWYGYDSFIWCRAGAACAVPSYRDAPELNLCADGSLPHEDERVNPCDPGHEYGTNFTVPAQQFNVITAYTVAPGGGVAKAFIYYGERANSAPDSLFSHNFQAWVPINFTGAGVPLPLSFPPSFTLDLADDGAGAAEAAVAAPRGATARARR